MDPDNETVADDTSSVSETTSDQEPVETKPSPEEPLKTESQSAKTKLEALKQARGQRAEQRELDELRSFKSQAESDRAELAELKRKLSDLPTHIKDLGLDPKDLANKLANRYQKEIFDEEPEPEDPVKKDLNELKAWKKQQEDERQESIKRYNQTKAELDRSNSVNVARGIIERSKEQFPTLIALGEEGIDMVINIFQKFADDPANRKLISGLTQDDLKIFAELAEEETFNREQARFKSFHSIPKFRSLVEQTELEEKKIKKSKKIEEQKNQTFDDVFNYDSIVADERDQKLEKLIIKKQNERNRSN